MVVKFKEPNDLMIFNNVTGNLSVDDIGVDRIGLVKNLVSELDSDTAHKLAVDCGDVRGFSVFVLGGILTAINDNDWYKPGGSNSFQEYVETHIGIQKSTAYDYMKIYRNLIESGVLWSEIEHIGWTKIRWFAKYLTKENLNDWVQAATSKNVKELKNFVNFHVEESAKKVLNTPNPYLPEKFSTQVENLDDEGADEKPTPLAGKELISSEAALATLKNRSFKLYPEQDQTVSQAIEKAMDEFETNHKGAALEAICLSFLSTYSPVAHDGV